MERKIRSLFSLKNILNCFLIRGVNEVSCIRTGSGISFAKKNPEHSIITITDGGKKTDEIYFIGYFDEVF